MSTLSEHIEGGCHCRNVRYRLLSNPLIVHCCHCRDCQRQTGTAFALNALFDARQVDVLKGVVSEIVMETPSGRGQTIARCPQCQVAVWSNYYMGGIDKLIRFIRVGTLDNPDLLPPDIHIFTATRQPWVTLPEDAAKVEIFYNFKEVWSSESLAVRTRLLETARINQ